MAATLTSPKNGQHYDGETETYVPMVAPTLRARPPGTDVDTCEPLIPTIAFHAKQSPVSGGVSPAMGTNHSGSIAVYNPHRTLQKDGSAVEGFKPETITDALHGPTGNKEPLIGGEQEVRRLTPTECERLQGFPDGWTEGHADSVRYRMLGNSVAVPCVEWIAKRIAIREKTS